MDKVHKSPFGLHQTHVPDVSYPDPAAAAPMGGAAPLGGAAPFGGTAPMGGAAPLSSSLGSNLLSNPMASAVMGMVVSQVAESGALSDVRKAWIPSGMMAIRSYFNVSHEFVLRKLGFTLFPFFAYLDSGYKDKLTMDDISGPEEENRGKKTVFVPDLYIPLMAFITYILLFGLTRGTVDNFHPEILGSTASCGGVVMILELLVAKAEFLFWIVLPSAVTNSFLWQLLFFVDFL
eukprot:GHVL01044632.1.p1 GENE.GHVL01044632.1~~GHVL01044632.1.p1  ORF type:complete len:234 (+),score=44.56 GHVL01044632.1:26-727(+)